VPLHDLHSETDGQLPAVAQAHEIVLSVVPVTSQAYRTLLINASSNQMPLLGDVVSGFVQFDGRCVTDIGLMAPALLERVIDGIDSLPRESFVRFAD
jgi:hypothetical protein